MGSMIELAIGRLEIDYGKNEYFRDYKPLFQKNDLANVPYEYVRDATSDEDDDDWESRIYVEWKRGLAKPLWQVIDRIQLLGLTEKHISEKFISANADLPPEYKEGTFDKLKSLFEKLDLARLDYNVGNSTRIYKKEIIKSINETLMLNEKPWEEDEQTETIEIPILQIEDNHIEFLSAISLLHLFNQNSKTSNLPVYWCFDDVEEGGYAPLSSFVGELAQEHKFLIVTEGSSDSKILKHALKLLKPHIEDFFTFVDMEEGYPFSGVGSMMNFVKGLISIAIMNNVIVLFDNDTEGIETYNKCKILNLPPNMEVIKLPDMPQFEEFRTVGPTGSSIADINGKAVAIECFLQLKASAEVRWNNYNKNIKGYQGELIAKDDYKRDFLSQSELQPDYDYSKLNTLLELIIKHSVQIKEKLLLSST